MVAVILATSVVIVWLVPRAVGDLFMTLAGGQDVLEGRLGQPDDWSFMTGGRIWINQAWGSGVLFYLAHSLMGDGGLVAMKALLIVTAAVFLVLASRRLGAGAAASMLVTGALLMASRHFIEIRPNLVGLTSLAVLQFLLYFSIGHRHRIWLAMCWLTVWANLHGSFLFGLGMLGLWTVCIFGALLWKRAPRTDLIRQWPVPAAFLAALILAVWTSPFGFTNLTQPLTLMFGDEGKPWPVPAVEMRPILIHGNIWMSGFREFFFVLGLLGSCFLAWVCYCRAARRPLAGEGDSGRVIAVLFSAILVVVTACMSFMAWRFIALFLFASIPVLAVALRWLLRNPRLAWPTAVLIPALMGLGLLLEQIVPPTLGLPQGARTAQLAVDLRVCWSIVTVVFMVTPVLVALAINAGRSRWPAWSDSVLMKGARWLTDAKRLAWPAMILALVVVVMVLVEVPTLRRHYRADHPLYPPHSLLQRMIFHSAFPVDGARFINDNDIGGAFYNDRRWEGFLRWHCPQVKLFLGGRSRQVYSRETAKRYARIRRGKDGYLEDLFNIGVRFVVLARKDVGLFKKLYGLDDSPWAAIYFDSYCVILAHRDHKEGRRLIDDAIAGQLKYPGPEQAMISRAVCLFSKVAGASGNELIAAAAAANLASPTPEIYLLLLDAMNKNKITPTRLVSYLRSEQYRLEHMNYCQSEGAKFLESRERISVVLHAVYEAAGRPQEADFWRRYGAQVRKVLQSLRKGISAPPIDPLPR